MCLWQVIGRRGFALIARACRAFFVFERQEVPSGWQQSIREMQGLAMQFFARPREERCDVGRLRFYRNKASAVCRASPTGR